MLGDVPDDMVGIYDIVHVRLVMLVIKDNDPLPLIKNLCKLLSEYNGGCIDGIALTIYYL
jgi:hypothetical protein